MFKVVLAGTAISLPDPRAAYCPTTRPAYTHVVKGYAASSPVDSPIKPQFHLTILCFIE
jgi:hypothetical protein